MGILTLSVICFLTTIDSQALCNCIEKKNELTFKIIFDKVCKIPQPSKSGEIIEMDQNFQNDDAKKAADLQK